MQEQPSLKELLEDRRHPRRAFCSTLRFLLVLLALFSVVTILFTQIFVGVNGTISPDGTIIHDPFLPGMDWKVTSYSGAENTFLLSMRSPMSREETPLYTK